MTMFSLVLILFSTSHVPEPKADATSEAKTSKQKQADKTVGQTATPDQALRSFLVAMLLGDEATLRQVTLPTDDFRWLLSKQDLPDGEIEQIKAALKEMPIRALKPGEQVTLPGPGNRKLKVKPEEVTSERAILVSEMTPIPTRIRKVEGRWKVDATPLIAGRKAADALQKKKARRIR